MGKKLLWLGFYLKERNVFKIIKYFSEGISIKDILKFKNYSENEIKSLAEKELEKAEKLKVKILFIKENEFSVKLREINYPPLFIYLKRQFQDKNSIAIIGSRKLTPYDEEISYHFAKRLSKEDIGIVFRLAKGIDSIARKGCLDTKGYTIGVLGSGLDIVYRAENKELLEKILKNNGAIISEFPFFTKLRKQNFPIRNRIIGGLSQGIIVIEAGKKSGTLFTARWALDQGKEVFATFRSIFSSQSEGTHHLIKEVIIIVTSPEKILNYFGWKDEKVLMNPKEKIDLSEEEKELISHLSAYPQHIEEIFIKINKPTFIIHSLLSELELKGLIESLPRNHMKLKKI